MMKKGVEDNSCNSVSNLNTIGRDENSSKSLPKFKNSGMILGVYKLMMNQEVQHLNTVDFEELQRFLSKLSSVKKTVKKLYDK
jgi:hypothetical protein